MKRRFSAALAAVLIATACSRDSEPAAAIELDGSARLPDRAGIVDKVSVERITIDGEEFDLSRKLLSFSTYTLQAQPIVGMRDAYVHAGVKGGKVVWVALVARLLESGDEPAKAFYNGTVARARQDALVFEDGTVLRPAQGVDLPPPGARLIVEIDLEHDRAVAVRSG